MATKPTNRKLKDYYNSLGFIKPEYRKIAQIILNQAHITKVDGKSYIDIENGWLIRSLCREDNPDSHNPKSNKPK